MLLDIPFLELIRHHARIGRSEAIPLDFTVILLYSEGAIKVFCTVLCMPEHESVRLAFDFEHLDEVGHGFGRAALIVIDRESVHRGSHD